MAPKTRKAKAKKTIAISKRESAISNKWIRVAKTKKIPPFSNVFKRLPPDWSGQYTIRFSEPSIASIVLDGVEQNQITLELQYNAGISGYTYLCRSVPPGRQGYWDNTVFLPVGDVALAAPTFKDASSSSVAAPYPFPKLTTDQHADNNSENLFVAAIQGKDSQTECLLGTIVGGGTPVQVWLYRLRKSLQLNRNLRGDVLLVKLINLADVNGGFPGGWGTGTKP